MRAEIKVSGIVQGVGFRPFIYRKAVNNRLTGFVRNRGDAGVKIVVEGKQSDIKEFLQDLKTKKPALAQIYSTQVNYQTQEEDFSDFQIT